MGDLRAMASGLQMGKTALSGLMPSPQNPRGAAPGGGDPLAPTFQGACSYLETLGTQLKNEGAQRSGSDYDRVMRMCLDLEKMARERAADFAPAPMQQGAGGGMATPFPNVNAGGIYGG